MTGDWTLRVNYRSDLYEPTIPLSEPVHVFVKPQPPGPTSSFVTTALTRLTLSAAELDGTDVHQPPPPDTHGAAIVAPASGPALSPPQVSSAQLTAPAILPVCEGTEPLVAPAVGELLEQPCPHANVAGIILPPRHQRATSAGQLLGHPSRAATHGSDEEVKAEKDRHG